MGTMGIVAIIIAGVASIAAIICGIYSVKTHNFVKKLQYNIKRPHTASPWLMEKNKSVRVFPQNIGGEVATNFRVIIRYPNNSKIKVLEPGSFLIEKGGIEKYFVTLQKGRVYPGAWLQPIKIIAEEKGKEVPPLEVLSWCNEESGTISFPPELYE